MLLSDMFFVDWNSCDTNKLFVCIGVVGLGGSICLDPPEAFNAKNPDRFLCLVSEAPGEPGGTRTPATTGAPPEAVNRASRGIETPEEVWKFCSGFLEDLEVLLWSLEFLFLLAPCETDFLVKGETGI